MSISSIRRKLTVLLGFAGMMSVVISLQNCKRIELEDQLKVRTGSIFNITTASVSINGEVIFMGSSDILQHGFCLAINEEPTIGSELVSHLGSRSSKGDFESTFDNLQSGTSYRVRAYATDESGTSYGEEKSFSTLQASLPLVTTGSAGSVSQTSAILDGTVTDDGGGSITDRGFYYGTGSSPQSAGTKVSGGSGAGGFNVTVSDLNPGTRYYYVAYATNGDGTGYGAVKDFSTPVYAPSVTTLSAISVTGSTATVNGNVTDNGGAIVTERGIYYGTGSDPSASGTRAASGSGTGTFQVNLTGLDAGTRYYFVAYALNSAGVSYGGTLYFETTDGGNSLTDIDGNVYMTVGIGKQVWMAENLRVTKYADGTMIDHAETASQWSSLGQNDWGYCWYDNDPDTYKHDYGALYTWATAMRGAGGSSSNPSGVQGVCPDDWHLPSDAEIRELEEYLGMDAASTGNTDWRGSDEGGKMKEEGTMHWLSPNTGATNSSGLTILPSGSRNPAGTFIDAGSYGRYWSASGNAGVSAFYRAFKYNEKRIYRNDADLSAGFAVRCVKD